jgi:hypothetical protein
MENKKPELQPSATPVPYSVAKPSWRSFWERTEQYFIQPTTTGIFAAP